MKKIMSMSEKEINWLQGIRNDEYTTHKTIIYSNDDSDEENNKEGEEEEEEEEEEDYDEYDDEAMETIVDRLRRY
jgi:hypothetical protein